MKAFKCLMGVGQGSRVRATNDNVLRRAWCQRHESASVVSFHPCVCVFFPPFSFIQLSLSSFFFWFICVLLGYVHLS